ncbi:four-carbon acid sugar kinase family protein [Sediminibacillus massiliensis]|uniref:four-carbon acid sugar kinase family protein n=1 Tax=Sediminibacillus massiliensis TaxID=1926277 RepID=UPI0009887C57|nr:four-carbon acid sugar kinase family protein [Sediminibacillus massiliensis]
MKISVIADDLTGASDSGVQLAKRGLRSSVLFTQNKQSIDNKDVLIFDTASRSAAPEDAYKKVREVSAFIQQNVSSLVYKKVDSTMRGNIGQEINAVFDTFQPEFAIIAPGFPATGRQVINGNLYVHNHLLHETEAARDPKTPVGTSYIPQIIEEQSNRQVGLITCEKIRYGHDSIKKSLEVFKETGIRYIVFDSKEDNDLAEIVKIIKQTEYQILWVGSAGLCQHIQNRKAGKQTLEMIPLSDSCRPVLLVVGSISARGRVQLANVLRKPHVSGLQVDTQKLVQSPELRNKELTLLKKKAGDILEKGHHPAIYSTDDLESTRKIGNKNGYSKLETSNLISIFLGELAASIIKEHGIKRVFLTGGDTASHVFDQLDTREFELLNEVESGIPLGKLHYGCNQKRDLYVITKAGSFGTDNAMIKSVKELGGKI